MKPSNIIKALFICIMTVALSSMALAEQVVIITHASYKGTSISQNDLKKIYLGKKKTLPEGGNANPVDQSANSPARKIFYSVIVKKSPSKLKSYWSKKIFTGKGTPPKIVGDDGAVLDWVGRHPGSLGYISKSFEVNSKVKVLTIK